jgi:hypothetical protein
MNRVLACVFLSLGTVLVVYGLNAVDSVGAAFSRLVSGAPSEPALWFLLAGIAASLIGAGSLFRSPEIHPVKSRPSHPEAPQARPARPRR